MPPQGIPFHQTHESILQFEEITQVVRIAAQSGVRSIRLTGGEPLVRKGIVELVRMIASVPGIEDISLTTNGLLLEQFAAPLKDAGLSRVNVSLDTLKPDKFKRITRGGSFDRVWAGILAAADHGLDPVKINVVAMRGVNDDEFVDLACLTREHDWSVRFIELMPLENQAPWGPEFPDPSEAYLPVQLIKEKLAHLKLEPFTMENGSGPARLFRLQGAKGNVGFISPLGEHFCDTCNRLRLTADGNLRPCLLSDIEIPVRDALRRGEDIRTSFQNAVEVKPSGHELCEKIAPAGRGMSQIGG